MIDHWSQINWVFIDHSQVIMNLFTHSIINHRASFNIILMIISFTINHIMNNIIIPLISTSIYTTSNHFLDVIHLCIRYTANCIMTKRTTYKYHQFMIAWINKIISGNNVLSWHINYHFIMLLHRYHELWFINTSKLIWLMISYICIYLYRYTDMIYFKDVIIIV